MTDFSSITQKMNRLNPDIKEGAVVFISDLSPVQKQSIDAGDSVLVKGTVRSVDPRTNLYVVEVSGKQFIVAAGQLRLTERLQLLHRVNEELSAPSRRPVDNADIRDETLTTDPFEVEIQRLMKAKITQVSNDLVELKQVWIETSDQQLGEKLTSFVGYALPYLDHLIVLVGVAKAESELKTAFSSFQEMLSMSSEVVDDTNVKAWVDMQLDTIKDIL